MQLYRGPTKTYRNIGIKISFMDKHVHNTHFWQICGSNKSQRQRDRQKQTERRGSERRAERQTNKRIQRQTDRHMYCPHGHRERDREGESLNVTWSLRTTSHLRTLSLCIAFSISLLCSKLCGFVLLGFDFTCFFVVVFLFWCLSKAWIKVFRMSE